MNKQDLQKVLWDINEESISALPADFIIQRILSYGGLFLAVKAIHEYGNLAVKQVFETMKPTSIPARKYYYIKNFLLI
ncbi:MAG: hypothetical protein UW27_C0002G0031 [Parcubacteria group bacterium GW2011_GWA1_44_13]|uniref:Uncharacterized protein n=1 Tax=Candidatus Nomurabacteria bacterium GW2011_GWB1_44_12 TaxID=1618748 RepID=A0A837I8B9_9BACT|nr:MAG: hypothetical protein UW17_C0017G0005 [Candidatus Nomurabacteria bacterium GW2011_GWD1_44_10]KKT37086.1 MAG: hypothetical protein UW25_C0002G0032 [Candidatus Nomurabacteria bacterium GW2011_GWB1_44_12]KKT38381.1 MAG: hypothetical protein UW27_C0002G0031 [Parcubacteria group bacterium GW2011_GWA1_44_13]HBB44429.1 hypothetical protein [Candidatus Yonathbacteria bacterium]